MASGRALGFAAAAALASCAHAPAAPAARTRLALLPAESEVFPSVATELNTSLRDAPVAGVDERFMSKVSLEVVQLSIECVDATNACYAAVGKALGADRLLLGQVGAVGGNKAPRVMVMLFDVRAGRPIHVAERIFGGEPDAARGVKALVDEAVAPANAAVKDAAR